MEVIKGLGGFLDSVRAEIGDLLQRVSALEDEVRLQHDRAVSAEQQYRKLWTAVKAGKAPLVSVHRPQPIPRGEVVHETDCRESGDEAGPTPPQDQDDCPTLVPPQEAVPETDCRESGEEVGPTPAEDLGDPQEDHNADPAVVDGNVRVEQFRQAADPKHVTNLRDGKQELGRGGRPNSEPVVVLSFVPNEGKVSRSGLKIDMTHDAASPVLTQLPNPEELNPTKESRLPPRPIDPPPKETSVRLLKRKRRRPVPNELWGKKLSPVQPLTPSNRWETLPEDSTLKSPPVFQESHSKKATKSATKSFKQSSIKMNKLVTKMEQTSGRRSSTSDKQPTEMGKSNPVVRGKDARAGLKAVTCKDCEEGFRAIANGDEEKYTRLVQQACKHRYHFTPPKHPEWIMNEIGFPETETEEPAELSL